MLYNDTNTKLGVCQEIDSICKSNTVSYPLDDKNRRLNGALDDFVLLALKEASGWSVEDFGETDLPISRANIVSGQQDYAFPEELLVLEKLEILPANSSSWIELTPVNEIDSNSGSGVPTEYKKVGNSFLLSPTPNYSLSLGIRAHYRRGFNYSSVSNSTFLPTSPGIPTQFHMWLARKASLPYLVENGISNKNDIAALIADGDDKIIAYFGRRPKDVKRRMVAARQSNK